MKNEKLKLFLVVLFSCGLASAIGIFKYRHDLKKQYGRPKQLEVTHEQDLRPFRVLQEIHPPIKCENLVSNCWTEEVDGIDAWNLNCTFHCKIGEKWIPIQEEIPPDTKNEQCGKTGCVIAEPHTHLR